MHEPWVHQLAPTRVFFIFSPIRCWIGFLKNILDLRSCTFFSTRPRLGKTDLHYTISYFIMSQVCTAVLLVVVIAHWREETVTWNSRMQNELSWVWCVLSRQTLDFASIYFSWAHKLLSFLRSAWILDHTKKAEVYRIGFTFFIHWARHFTRFKILHWSLQSSQQLQICVVVIIFQRCRASPINIQQYSPSNSFPCGHHPHLLTTLSTRTDDGQEPSTLWLAPNQAVP